MPKSSAQVLRGLEDQRLILAALDSGVKTSEELRVAIADTKQVLYNVLRKLIADGMIEASNPKNRSIMKKYRLTEKGRNRSPPPKVCSIVD